MKYNLPFLAFNFIFVGVLIAACDPIKRNSNLLVYKELCSIYEQIVQKPIAINEKEGRLAEKIKGEFPKFFEDNYSHIMFSDRNERYALTKKLAEMVTGKEWACVVMENYYAGAYDESVDS